MVQNRSPDPVNASALGVPKTIGIAPGDTRYVADSGVTHHPQDEGGAKNSSYYEINSNTNEIDFDVSDEVSSFDNPVLKIYQLWGSTEFTLVDRDGPTDVISEVSGFGENVWAADISSTGGNLRLTDFTSNQADDGTQAAVVDYVEVVDVNL